MSDQATDTLRNIGAKSAAWLRQVGIHTRQELVEHGAIDAFLRVKRAGFRPSLNLLYALIGALEDCHWQKLPQSRRLVLQEELAQREAELGITDKPDWGGPPRPVTTIRGDDYDGGA